MIGHPLVPTYQGEFLGISHWYNYIFMSKNSIQLQDTLYLGVRFKSPPPPLVKYLDLNQGGYLKRFSKTRIKRHIFIIWKYDFLKIAQNQGRWVFKTNYTVIYWTFRVPLQMPIWHLMPGAEMPISAPAPGADIGTDTGTGAGTGL